MLNKGHWIKVDMQKSLTSIMYDVGKIGIYKKF